MPGRQCRQRLLTLMLDEEMMAPSWPVAWSQAAMERVMARSRLMDYCALSGLTKNNTIGPDFGVERVCR